MRLGTAATPPRFELDDELSSLLYADGLQHARASSGGKQRRRAAALHRVRGSLSAMLDLFEAVIQHGGYWMIGRIGGFGPANSNP